MIRMTIDHASGSLEILTDRRGALGDVAIVLTAVDAGANRNVELVDRDGQTHHVNLGSIDRIDLTWEPGPATSDEGDERSQQIPPNVKVNQIVTAGHVGGDDRERR